MKIIQVIQYLVLNFLTFFKFLNLKFLSNIVKQGIIFIFNKYTTSTIPLIRRITLKKMLAHMRLQMQSIIFFSCQKFRHVTYVLKFCLIKLGILTKVVYFFTSYLSYRFRWIQIISDYLQRQGGGQRTVKRHVSVLYSKFPPKTPTHPY